MKAKFHLLAALVAIGAFTMLPTVAQAGNRHHHHHNSYSYNRYYYNPPAPVYYRSGWYNSRPYYYGRPYYYRPYYAPAPVQIGVSFR